MSITSLQKLEDAHPEERLRRLTTTPEDQWFDRKSGRIAPKDLARTVVAFANAEGGTIVVGLSDGNHDGGLLTVDRENALLQTGMDFTVPPVRTYVTRLDVGENRRVLNIDVPPSERVHETNTGDVYLRVGDESKKLSFTQRKELEYDRGAAYFEAEAVPDVTLDDLDARQLSLYREAIGASSSIETALRARSLLRRDGRPNHATSLLLGRHPQEALPQAYVRVMRFARDAAGTGARQTLESGKDQRFEGPIPTILDNASNCIDEWMPKHRALDVSGRFDDVPLIPKDAWLEGLVNAVVHRSYSMAGTTSGSASTRVASRSKALVAFPALRTRPDRSRSPGTRGIHVSPASVRTSESPWSAARASSASSRRCGAQGSPTRCMNRPAAVCD